MEQTINKEQLIDAVKNIPIISEQEGWVLTLDKEEGALFYAPPIIPDDSKLHQVTDEYALYLDKNFNPTGVVVEYYQANFLRHHDAFGDITSKIFGSRKKDGEEEKIVTVDPKQAKKDTEIFKALLETTLIKEAGSSFVPA